MTATGTISLPSNSVTYAMLADNILVKNLYATRVLKGPTALNVTTDNVVTENLKVLGVFEAAAIELHRVINSGSATIGNPTVAQTKFLNFAEGFTTTEDPTLYSPCRVHTRRGSYT